jgi:hypothetical protein
VEWLIEGVVILGATKLLIEGTSMRRNLTGRHLGLLIEGVTILGRWSG